MKNFDPTAPLLDIWFADDLDAPLRTIEQPQFSCPCNEGWIPNDWLYCMKPREPNCTCPAQTDDFIDTLHAVSCDSVPCPLCFLDRT